MSQLTLELTQQCPNRCVHCSTYSEPAASLKLEIDVVKALINDAHVLGLEKLILSGGEPLVYPDLDAVLDCASSLKIKEVVIYTSGSVLGAHGDPISVMRPNISRLLKKGVTRFNVSLHSAKAEIHDSFMATPGSWDRAVDFLETAHDIGSEVEIHCVLTRDNADEVSALAAFLEEKGIKVLRLLRLVPQGRGARSFEGLAPTIDHLRRASEQIERWKGDSHSLSIKLGAHLSGPLSDEKYSCSLDSGKLLVSPNGALSVCPALKGLHGQLGRRKIFDQQLAVVLESDWRKGVSNLKELYSSSSDCPAQVLYGKKLRDTDSIDDEMIRPAPLSDIMLLGNLALNLRELMFREELEGRIRRFIEKAREVSDSSDKVFSLFTYAGEAKKSNIEDIPTLYDLWRDVLQASLDVLNSCDLRQNPAAQSVGASPVNLTPAIIDQLATYYKKLGEFESVLYGSDPWYRDHVVHVLRVWLLGLRVIFDLPNARLSEPPVTGRSVMDKKLFRREELVASFSVAALTHDIGYPLEKVSKVNSALAKILDSFGGLTWSPSTVAFSRPRYDIAQQLLRLISSKPEFRNENGDSLTEEELDQRINDRLNQYRRIKNDVDLQKAHELAKWGAVFRTQWKYFQKYLDSFERNEHGFLSALLLLQKLLFFKEGEFAIEEDYYFSLEEARQFMLRREILRACASHTCSDIYILDPTSIDGLLFFVDEIQEWGRPAFRDLYSGKGVDESPRVFLLEYSRKRVCWEVEVGRLDEASSAFWLLSAGRKLFDRLRTAPEWGERGFEVEWRLTWETESCGMESRLLSRNGKFTYMARKRDQGQPIDLMALVWRLHRGDEMDMVRRDLVEKLRTV